MKIRNQERFESILSGQRVELDLGCGGILRGTEGITIGVDISEDTAADIIGDVVFEKLPVPESSIDIVHCHDFIEHVPFAIWVREKDGSIQRQLPMIDLFNEIYRVLKDGGTMDISVPYSDTNLLHREIFQDPTHVSFWTPETFNYFAGDYYGFHDVYGHTSRFKKTSVVPHNAHLRVTLTADKHSEGQYLV